MPERRARPFRPWTGYGLVFALLVVSFIWTAASDTRADRAGRVVLEAAILLLALRAAGIRRHVIAIVTIPLVVAVAAALVASGRTEEAAQGVVAVISAAILAGVPAAVFLDIRRTWTITPHLIMGLLCVYLMIGIFFAIVFRAVDHFSATQFFAQTSRPNRTDYLYFSFATLTTVGYGDLTAAENLGRTLAVVEALTGQLYLVTVVALAVANMGVVRSGRHARDAQPDETS